jgi:3-hydroxybutyryl-CoA dehydrogenase
MGRGIAQWFAQQHIRVELVDAKLAVATEAHKKVMLSWEKLKEKGKFTKEEIEKFADHIFPIEASDCERNSDLLIEAIVENLKIKKQVLRELDEEMDEKCIFASNTSSFPISEMAQALSAQRQKNFLGLHFFNPAPIMKLVEVVQGSETPPELVQKLSGWLEGLGKKAAICADGPGFIVNRVARNFYGESLRLANGKPETQETFEELDNILKKVGGFRMGAFELMDLIGVDVNLEVSESVWKSFYHEPRFAPHPLQKKMVSAQRLGRKTGRGFYSYE